MGHREGGPGPGPEILSGVSRDGMGERGPGRGWTPGRQDLCSFPGLPLTLCDMSLFRESSCRNLWFWSHRGLQELGARNRASGSADGQRDGQRQGSSGSYSGWSSAACSFPSAPITASSHPCPKDHSREIVSLTSGVQASLLAGIPCSLPSTCHLQLMRGTGVEVFVGCAYHDLCTREMVRHSAGSLTWTLHRPNLGCSHHRLLSQYFCEA